MRIPVLSCASIVMFGMLAMAQMMGSSGGNHMGGNSGMGNDVSVGNTGMGGMGGYPGMNMAGGMGIAMDMADGAITVGSDGTLYILSRTFAQTSQTGSIVDSVKTRLSALDTTGNVLRSLDFDEYWLTRPVQGPDGRLFLVAFGDMGMGSSMSGNNTVQNLNSKLYIVDLKLQNVIRAIELEGEAGSVPTIIGSGGSYAIYVATFDMGHNFDNQGTAQGPRRQSTLYAFRPDGSLIFSRPLNP